MAIAPAFDVAAAHAHFASHCFNSAWDLIDKPDRTLEEDLLMVVLNQASIYHWLNRADCAPRNLSIGYWQASRIQSLLANAAEAKRHAEVCLSYSLELEPFYLGYAHEALARAAWLAGEHDETARQLALAHAQAALVTRSEDQAALLEDLHVLALKSPR